MRTHVLVIFSRSPALFPVKEVFEDGIFCLCYQLHIFLALKNKKPPINGGLKVILYTMLYGNP